MNDPPPQPPCPVPRAPSCYYCTGQGAGAGSASLQPVCRYRSILFSVIHSYRHNGGASLVVLGLSSVDHPRRVHPADACTRCEGTFGDRFPSSVLAPSPTSTLTLRLSDSAAKHTVPSFPFAYDHPAHAPLRGWGGSGVRSAPAVLYGLYCTVVRRGLRSPSFPVFALFRWRPSTGCIYLRYSLIIIWRPFTGLSRVRVRSVPGRTEGSAVLPYGIMKSCNLPVGGHGQH